MYLRINKRKIYRSELKLKTNLHFSVSIVFLKHFVKYLYIFIYLVFNTPSQNNWFILRLY